MFTLPLTLFLLGMPQVTSPQQEAVQYVGPYKFREDQGQTTKVTLLNGLTVLVREEHTTPLANVTTYVKAGYFDEDDRISGIAHVIEHMFFKGTARRPVGAIARETKTLGGYLNAYTYYDRTVYYTVVPSENALKALDIQADALWNSSFDADELKRRSKSCFRRTIASWTTRPRSLLKSYTRSPSTSIGCGGGGSEHPKDCGR